MFVGLASGKPGPSVATISPVISPVLGSFALTHRAFIHALHSPPTSYYFPLSSTNESTVSSIQAASQKQNSGSFKFLLCGQLWHWQGHKHASRAFMYHMILYCAYTVIGICIMLVSGVIFESESWSDATVRTSIKRARRRGQIRMYVEGD